MNETPPTRVRPSRPPSRNVIDGPRFEIARQRRLPTYRLCPSNDHTRTIAGGGETARALSQLITLARFEADREAALAALPQKFGYQSLEGFIAAVTEACAPKTRRYHRRKAAPPKKPKATTIAAAPAPEQPMADTAGDGIQQAPSLPIGSDLNDSQNFGVQPDISLIDTPAAPDTGYMPHTTSVLPDSKPMAYAHSHFATIQQQDGNSNRRQESLARARPD